MCAAYCTESRINSYSWRKYKNFSSLRIKSHLHGKDAVSKSFVYGFFFGKCKSTKSSMTKMNLNIWTNRSSSNQFKQMIVMRCQFKSSLLFTQQVKNTIKHGLFIIIQLTSLLLFRSSILFCSQHIVFYRRTETHVFIPSIFYVIHDDTLF